MYYWTIHLIWMVFFFVGIARKMLQFRLSVCLIHSFANRFFAVGCNPSHVLLFVSLAFAQLIFIKLVDMAENFSGKRVRQTGLFECGIVKKFRVVQETGMNMKYLS